MPVLYLYLLSLIGPRTGGALAGLVAVPVIRERADVTLGIPAGGQIAGAVIGMLGDVTKRVGLAGLMATGVVDEAGGPSERIGGRRQAITAVIDIGGDLAKRIDAGITSNSPLMMRSASGVFFARPWYIVRPACSRSRMRRSSTPQTIDNELCGSQSIAKTRCPFSCRARAMLIVDVVFPTPPFWFAMAITFADMSVLYLGAAQVANSRGG